MTPTATFWGLGFRPSRTQRFHGLQLDGSLRADRDGVTVGHVNVLLCVYLRQASWQSRCHPAAVCCPHWSQAPLLGNQDCTTSDPIVIYCGHGIYWMHAGYSRTYSHGSAGDITRRERCSSSCLMGYQTSKRRAVPIVLGQWHTFCLAAAQLLWPSPAAPLHHPQPTVHLHSTCRGTAWISLRYV